MEVHVVPLNDTGEHALETDCDCGVHVDWEDGILVIHSAYNGQHAGPFGVFAPDEPWHAGDEYPLADA